jgi:nucleoid DNA-binding protein
MTRIEFAEKLAGRLNISKKEADKIVKEFIDLVIDTLENGEEIKFNGFGKFYVKTYPERKARNPKTGEEILLPERRIPKFKFANKVKDTIL